MANSDPIKILTEDSDSEINEDWTPDFEKNQKRKLFIKRILKQCGKDDGRSRPLNVAIIGAHGVGKSSFVNTLAAALGGDRWREYAYAGSHGPKGGGITVFTTSFPKCCKSEQYRDVLLPTLIDIAGFDNEHGEGYIELLRIVLFGRLPVGESLAEAEQYYKNKGLDGLRAKYSQNSEILKVDRVIFLSSATVDVPVSLIQCVMQAARPSGTKEDPNRRVIPVYGVMLKYDRVVSKGEYDRIMADQSSDVSALDIVDRETYEKRESGFINALGLRGSEHRFKRCSNYCDAVDKDKKRTDTVIPDLDLPVLELFVQVTDPVFEVINKDQTFINAHAKKEDVMGEGTTEDGSGDIAQNRETPERDPIRKTALNAIIDNIGEGYVSLMMLSLEALLVAFLLSFLLKSPLDVPKLKGICKAQFSQPNAALSEICEEINDANSASQVPFVLALFLLIAIRLAVTFVTVNLYKRR